MVPPLYPSPAGIFLMPGFQRDFTAILRERLDGVLDDIDKDLTEIGKIPLYIRQAFIVAFINIHLQIFVLIVKHAQGIINGGIEKSCPDFFRHSPIIPICEPLKTLLFDIINITWRHA